MGGSEYTVFQSGGPMITSCREKLREMCPFSHACSAVGDPGARQYSTSFTAVVEFRLMVPDPLGRLGGFVSRTAPGGGTNSPAIALASTVARCCGVPDGWTLAACAGSDVVERGALVAVPQLAASMAASKRKNGPVWFSFMLLGR